MSEIDKLKYALSMCHLTLEHALALDYLGEGSTKGMAEEAIKVAEKAMPILIKEWEPE